MDMMIRVVRIVRGMRREELRDAEELVKALDDA